ncbi:hypothetical protein B566_EDAN018472 [Ephemera danica]|nr:hypothetical protein B566_EDAN018472 [Ephemera danica]
MPASIVARNLDAVRAATSTIPFPIILRPAFTLGGAGGGVAYNMEDLESLGAAGLAASLQSEVLIEQSVLGWKEIEIEIVRDSKDTSIIICSIENFDPMGVHTGDSITGATGQQGGLAGNTVGSTAHMPAQHHPTKGFPMPKRTDLQRIMVIGSGPIIIGQACEFDYSGTQAVKALKEEGYEVILVNSNPATIMTDPDLADRTYIEPIEPETVAAIIRRERPDALLPTLGGQTALNTALSLAAMGVLDECKVELLGADIAAIEMAESRELFRIHSGDSACVLPPHTLPQAVVDEIHSQTVALAAELKVVGLMNIQFAVKDGLVYILEVNPRASRTAPFVSKATGVALPRLATQIMMGKTLQELDPGKNRKSGYISVKEAVFPFNRFPGVDILLGPEMRSTGEVMGIAPTFGEAFMKGQLAGGQRLPQEGKVFISVNDRDKSQVTAVAKLFHDLGFEILATTGTAALLNKAGVPASSGNYDKATHWQRVYSTQGADTVSWFTPQLAVSLEYVRQFAFAPAAPIIDVGGGASTFVDSLLIAGHTAVTVLDLAAEGLGVSQKRLGSKADQVSWLQGDITKFALPQGHYALWHDRAVFHFLLSPEDKQAYVQNMLQALRPGGGIIIAAFGPEGPTMCSNLPTARYSSEELALVFGPGCVLQSSQTTTHTTPGGVAQQFVYACFKKVALLPVGCPAYCHIVLSAGCCFTPSKQGYAQSAGGLPHQKPVQGFASQQVAGIPPPGQQAGQGRASQLSLSLSKRVMAEAAFFPSGYRAYRGKQGIAARKGIGIVLCDQTAYLSGFFVVRIIVACGKHIGTKQDTAFYFFPKTLRARCSVHASQALVFPNAQAIAHPIKTGKIGAGFCGSENIIGGYTIRQMG